MNSGRAAALLLLVALAADAEELRPLQELVDATPAGGELQLEAGIYAGPVVVRKPISIDGGGMATVDAGGQGSVFVLETNGARLRGLTLRGSGENHDTLDAGVQIRGDHNIVEDNQIEDCLFGVDLAQSDENTIRNNRIRSKDLDLGIRGDGIRLWYSQRNQILDNRIEDVRDIVVWYSGENRIIGNRVRGSRYALHFMYAKRNEVEDNDYRDNMVGIFLMYSDDVRIRRNRIVGAQGATGMGVGFKESSGVVLEENEIVYCAKGIYLDISPYETDRKNRFERNQLAYNGVGVMFHSQWRGNLFIDNDFVDNFTQVAVRGGGHAMAHTWRGNYWDDYQGFDQDHDGLGDRPHRAFAYSDRMWMQLPAAAFFRASPVFEALDFLDRLAPFADPLQILEDPSPRYEPRNL
ncbi:MAG: nitrous oxide reductase family maturation protein NosD [bacterium]|nr:nitrous oxide reductase family maturation protein NosD [bacterium]